MAVELIGLKELGAKLDKLSSKQSGQVLRKAANAAVKPVIAAARVNLIATADHKNFRPHKTYKGNPILTPGYAARHIGSKVSLSRDKRKVFAFIGVHREAFYATQFLELGTSRYAKEPWLVPALESTQSQTLTTFANAFKQHIEKVARAK